MPATTLILTPNVEQGEPSRASRIAAGVKQKVQQSRASAVARQTVAREQLGREDVEKDFDRQSLDTDRDAERDVNRESVGPQSDAGIVVGNDDRIEGRSVRSAEHSPNAGPHTEWSDVELVQAFQTGDERAFAELYTRRKREIYTFCVRMLGGDRDLASDAFQETFIKVYEKGHSFRSGANVMGWLFMIARNTCLNIHRSKRPSEPLEDQRMLVSSDRSLGPEFGEEQHHLHQLLEQAIALLPEEFREPFILREFDGFSYGEIAKMTGVSLPTTKVRIYRAKQRLRELLQPYLESDEVVETTQSSNSNGISTFIDKQEYSSDLRGKQILDRNPEEE